MVRADSVKADSIKATNSNPPVALGVTAWVLAGFYPLTRILGANPSQVFSLDQQELLWLAGLCLLCVCGQWGAWFWCKSWQNSWRLPAVMQVLLVGCFFWQPFVRFVGVADLWAAFSFVVALGCLAWLIWRVLGKVPKLMTAFYAAVVALGLGPIVQLATYSMYSVSAMALNTVHQQAKPLQADSWVREFTTQKPTAETLPNIYLFVYDTMVSVPHIAKYFDLNPGEKAAANTVLQQLKNQGLTALGKLHSNYARTMPSMQSFWNLQLLTDDVQDLRESGFFGFAHSRFRQILQAWGYKVYVTSNNFASTRSCPAEIDTCWHSPPRRNATALVVDATPLGPLLAAADHRLFAKHSLNLQLMIFGDLSTTKIKHLNQVRVRLAQGAQPDERRFVYGHFRGPHPKNYFDQDCRNPKYGGLFAEVSGAESLTYHRPEDYKQEYICMLRQISAINRTVQVADPGAWVVHMSDHGYGIFQYGAFAAGPWDEQRVESHFQVIGLSQTVPECDRQLAQVKTLVNLGRSLLNCLTDGAKLEYVEDSMHTLGMIGTSIDQPYPKFTLASAGVR